MKKVFWEDPYLQKLQTTVVSVEGERILFKETIAFSFSGGQESDKASVNGVSILGSVIKDNLIYYTLPEGHGLTEGAVANMEIYWPRRYRLMRLHFAAELILELVTQKYHLEKIGAHISEDKARIDFISDKNISDTFQDLLSSYNQIIEKDMVIEKGYLDLKNQRRYWKIEGFAEVPCGGTHVKSTKEVGFVSLKRVNIGKGKERIEIKLQNVI